MLNKNIHSWEDVIRRLIERCQRCNKKSIVVPAKNLCDPSKSELLNEAMILSLRKDSECVYRDERSQCSLQVRYYEDGDATPMGGGDYSYPVYHIQVDLYNPTKGIVEAIKHLFYDVIEL